MLIIIRITRSECDLLPPILSSIVAKVHTVQIAITRVVSRSTTQFKDGRHCVLRCRSEDVRIRRDVVRLITRRRCRSRRRRGIVVGVVLRIRSGGGVRVADCFAVAAYVVVAVVIEANMTMTVGGTFCAATEETFEAELGHVWRYEEE